MRNWLKNKLNIALLVCVGIFIIFAILTYVWQSFVYVALIGLSASFFVGGLIFNEHYKTLKHNLYTQLSLNNLTQKDVKVFKLKLKQLKTYSILLFVVAVIVLWRVFVN